MTTLMSLKGSKSATITYTWPKVKPTTTHDAAQRNIRRVDGWSNETHAWHNRFRRLLVRWEKKSTHYEAFIHVASVLIIFQTRRTVDMIFV